jgi:hypothetical protein
MRRWGGWHCFKECQVLAIINKAAMNIVEHVSFLPVGASSGYMPRRGIAGRSPSLIQSLLTCAYLNTPSVLWADPDSQLLSLSLWEDVLASRGKMCSLITTFLRHGVSLNLELTLWARRSGQQLPDVCWSLFLWPQPWGCSCELPCHVSCERWGSKLSPHACCIPALGILSSCTLDEEAEIKVANWVLGWHVTLMCLHEPVVCWVSIFRDTCHHLKRKTKSAPLNKCLSQEFYSCTNIMTTKQVGEERVYSAYTSTLLFITKGSQDWNPHRSGSRSWWRGHGGMFLAGLLPPGLLSLLSYRTQDYQPRDGTIHKGPSHPWSLIEKMPYSWISWRHFLTWGSFLYDNSSLC